MESERYRLQEAIFDRLSASPTPYQSLAIKHNVSISKIRTAFRHWCVHAPESQPQSPHDIDIPRVSRGRPNAIPKRHEILLAEAAAYYADNNTPLTKHGVSELILCYKSMLPPSEQQKFSFKNNTPSQKFIKNFLNRNGLGYRHVRQVEGLRLDALSPRNVIGHIARVRAAMKRFNINSPAQVFNMDQSGISLAKIVGRSLRKGVGPQNTILVQKTVRTKGSLDRVTIMPIVSADGKAYKPVVIFPGQRPHYRKVLGKLETLHSVLMDCYLFYRPMPGADSAIVRNWATKFVQETDSLRQGGKWLLLVLDGYSAHIQHSFLDFMKQNRIVVIALPAHTSHELQPLDVTVFGAYKSFLQAEFHRAARSNSTLNAFTVASCIHNAYSRAFVRPTIQAGFVKCGLWSQEKNATDVSALSRLFKAGEEVTVQGLVVAFNKSQRSLLRDADVEEEGRVRINTANGAHLTSETVLEALKKRAEKRADKEGKKGGRRGGQESTEARLESAEAMRRYAALADERVGKRKRLSETRSYRRFLRRSLAHAKRNDDETN